MDKRFRPLTASEQIEIRIRLYDTLRDNPGMSLSGALTMIRKALRITNEDICRLSGVSEKYVADTLAGRTNPSIRTAEKLLKPFGLKIGVVLDEDVPADQADGK
jgi:DNA-binding phage protein